MANPGLPPPTARYRLPVVGFIGRDAERERLSGMLGDGVAAVVISGEAGIGKTHLAEHVCLSADLPIVRGCPAGTLDADERVAVLVDDVRAGDVDDLQTLARAARRTPTVVIATVRDTTRSQRDVLARLLAGGAFAHLPLGGLTRAHAGELLAADGLAAETVDDLHTRTAGNPLLLRELAADPGGPLPARLSALLLDGIGGSGDGAREVLDLIAVIGAGAEVKDVEQLLQTADALGALDEAVDTGALIECDGVVRLRLPVLREALYAALPPGRRATLHRRVAHALEAIHGETPGPHLAALCRHHLHAATPDGAQRALRYAWLAGEQAQEAGEHPEAARLYGIGVELTAPGTDEQARMLLARGSVRYVAGDFAGARADFLGAAQSDDTDIVASAASGLSGHYGYDWGTPDPERLAVVRRACDAVGEEVTARRARLEIRHAEAVLFVDGAAAARPHAARALSLARRVGDPATLADTLVRYHYLGFSAGDVERRAEVSRRAFDYAAQADDAPLTAIALLLMVWDDLERGRTATAAESLEACATEAAALGDGYLRWYAHAIRAERAISAGRFADGLTLVDEALAIGAGEHNQNAFVVHVAQRAWLQWLQGRADEAMTVVRQIAEVAPAVPALMIAHAWLAGAAGDVPTARGLLEQSAADDFGADASDIDSLVAWVMLADVVHVTAAAEHAPRLRELLEPHADLFAVGFPATNFGSVHRALGQLAEALGETDEAIDRYHCAAQRNAEADLVVMAAMSDVDEARVLMGRHRRGDRRHALRLAQSAAGAAAAIGLPPVADVATRLMELGV